MLKKNRLENILSKLSEDEYTSSNELLKLLNIPKSTLNKDLIELSEKGLIKRDYGQIKKVINSENYLENKDLHIDEKIIISKISSKLIKDNMTIFIDAGTTAELLIKYMNIKLQNIKIYTNSLSLVERNKQYKYNMYLLSGYIDYNSMSTFSDEHENIINEINFDLSFISIYGAKGNYFSINKSNEIIFKRKIINNSKDSYILYDHSKIDKLGKYNLIKKENIKSINK